MTELLPEIGTVFLCLALITAILSGLVPQWGALRGDARLMRFADSGAIVQGIMIAGAFGVLTHAFVVSDFSVETVANNSHTLKPMLYKISGVWGNHEGSLVLWVMILTLFGAAVALFGQSLPLSLRARVLSVQSLVAVGFLSFTIFTSNPFARLDPAPIEGLGLNPLLQDPGLAFHPPFLYLGYVGFSIAFSFAIGALLEGKVDAAWARWVKPWTLAAWIFLTIGIALGSWWAYYELGWGGFWFWDPVENASLLPWLMGTALLHSVIVVERRDSLKRWTILLAIGTFSLSLLGTFLVRSGVLTSVHAFATDPERGVFILGFLVAVVGGSLTLYALRAGKLDPVGLFAPISREGALLINNWFLVSAAGTVLLGTLYPLFLDALTGEKITVGPPFFNATVLPIMVPLALAMAVGPWLRWRSDQLTGMGGRLGLIFGIAALAVFATVILTTDAPWWGLAGVGLGVWLIAGTGLDWLRRTGLLRGGFAKLPRSVHGMTLAHIGFGLVILGVVGNTGWTQEEQGLMKVGDKVTLGQYEFALEGVAVVPGPNYRAQQGTLMVSKLDSGGDAVWTAPFRPEMRHYRDPVQTTTEAAIKTSVLRDLFAVVGEGNHQQGFAVRVYVKPLVPWIWTGAGLMALGGLLSLSRSFARRPRQVATKEATV